MAYKDYNVGDPVAYDDSEGPFIDTAYIIVKTALIAGAILAVIGLIFHGIEWSKDAYYQRQGRAHVESLANASLVSKYKTGLFPPYKSYIFTVETEDGYDTFKVSPQNYYAFEEGDTVPIVSAGGRSIPLRGPGDSIVKLAEKAIDDWSDSSNAINSEHGFSIGWELSTKSW